MTQAKITVAQLQTTPNFEPTLSTIRPKIGSPSTSPTPIIEKAINAFVIDLVDPHQLRTCIGWDQSAMTNKRWKFRSKTAS